MKEVNEILSILRRAKQFVEDDDPYGLKNLSGETIQSATISQDADNIIVAVLIYSLGKVWERNHYRDMDGWTEFHSSVIKNLELAISSLADKDIKNTRICLGKIRNSLNKMSGNLKIYIKETFRKAEINRAFKLYEHGLSSEQTAELLGVSLWDLASYIGQSHINEAKIAISMPIAERIKIAEDIFR